MTSRQLPVVAAAVLAAGCPSFDRNEYAIRGVNAVSVDGGSDDGTSGRGGSGGKSDGGVSGVGAASGASASAGASIGGASAAGGTPSLGGTTSAGGTTGTGAVTNDGGATGAGGVKPDGGAICVGDSFCKNTCIPVYQAPCCASDGVCGCKLLFPPGPCGGAGGSSAGGTNG